MSLADLHCDLLSYLAENDKRSVFDQICRCSLPQLKSGKVHFQTLAVYSETGKHSVEFAKKQVQIFCSLPQKYPQDFVRLNQFHLPSQNEKIHIGMAFENASGLCDESEPLAHCFSRLDEYLHSAGPIIYISLTWNHENRFGGGNLTKVGLKPDGENLLQHLDGKGISIDLSHTSDALAEGIFNYLDKKGLNIPIIASHSNFRTICNQPRNLLDSTAKEIVRRGGVIGLNLFKHFLGENGLEDAVRHVAHARHLALLDHYCIGADFFYDDLLASSSYQRPFFHDHLTDASCYPYLFSGLNKVCSSQEIARIALDNLSAFFKRVGETCY